LKYSSSTWRRLGLVVPALFLVCGVAYAQGLPWETPLQTVSKSLTGPVAKAIGVVALAASGGMLAFGGELGEFTKRILMVVLALAVMLLANNFINLFGV
jgi:type IV secretion system protein TrbC